MNRLFSKLALIGKIDHFCANFQSNFEAMCKHMAEKFGWKSAKNGNFNNQMEFRKKSNDFLTFSEAKILHPSILENKVENLKKEGHTIATLNGSFDLFHAGHLHIIFEASKQADLLIVALNSDDSIKKYKSSNRPIISLEYRLRMMTALEFVDYVTWFDEVDPCALLKKIKPNVHVNGIEYGNNCVEAETVKSLGAKLYLVDRIPGLATSEVIKKIKEICD